MFNLNKLFMKKIYAFFSAVVICASALVLLSARSSNVHPLFEANIEALARIEMPAEECAEYCYLWYGDVCIVKKNGKDIPCTNMSNKIIHV